MTDLRPHPDAELLQHNQASLEELETVLRREAGEFSLTITACNYHRLRNLVVGHFVEHHQSQRLSLPPNTTSLVDTIQAHLGTATSPANLMVTGLELLKEAELMAVLKGANLSRDEFRKHFPFPIVLWMTERVRQQFIRYAPDLRSFGPSAIAFTLPPGELVYALQAGTNLFFANSLERGGDRTLSSTTIRIKGSEALRSEVEFAIQDLTASGVTPDPDLDASLDFLRGREAHSRLEMEAARDYYERSLAYWQAQVETGVQPESHPAASTPTLPPADKRAVLWLHLGLWWRNYGVLQRGTYPDALKQARQYFEWLLRYFREEDYYTRLAHFIHVLAEVLQKQRDWGNLEALAVEGITLHRETHDPIRLARDHGFLAEVALIREDWLTAQSEAQQALALLETAQDTVTDNPEELDLANALDIANSFQRGWYRFLLGEAQMHLIDPEQAIQYLEAARWETDPEFDLTLHRQVLEELIRHYFDLGKYWDAFDVKQELRQVEYRYNLRAFVGAGTVQPHQRPTVARRMDDVIHAAVAAEIRASGRLQDVEALVNRLQSDQKQLVIIHGPSGVGKSSILSAGLLPAVQRLYPQGRNTLPLLIQTYGNWQQSIATALDESLGIPPAAAVQTQNLALETQNLASLLERFRHGVAKNRFFILIFDQFEEFFFDKTDLADRRVFYEFLQKCIDQPWVKVVLALREDYLHHLLEAERIINQVSPMAGVENLDMLSREVRYSLANFSPKAAEAVIRQLTEAAHYPLEEELIHRLVSDLSAETGDVRPIELQVVGAQLQRQEVHTLAQYEGLGESPKETLVQEFLAYVVHDCGPPNEHLAWVVLYLLTDEDRDQRLYRPLRTREEIEYELSLLGMPFELDQLSMVLSILVGSGLAFEIPEEPEDRYQLVHDYLVRYVRDVQTPGLMAELEAARAAAKAAAAAREVAEVERDRLAEANTVLAAANEEAEEVVTAARKQARVIGVVAAAIALITIGLVSTATRIHLKRAENQKLDIDIQKKAAEVELLMTSGQNFEALKKATEIGRQIQKEVSVSNSIAYKQRIVSAAIGEPSYRASPIPSTTWLRAVSVLQKAIYLPGYLERNTLKGHNSGLLGVSFFSNGEIIASADNDGLVKLWNIRGQELQKVEGHSGTFFGVSFAPDEEAIAFASEDGTVKMWNFQDQKLQTLVGHKHWVLGISFSPDGETIASASRDKTVKLWDRQGQEIQTLLGHNRAIWRVSFSPDGDTIASASEDGTVKLWNLQGQELQTLTGHDSVVINVSFSPDGDTIASSTWDGTVKLWNLQGQELQTLLGHSRAVFGVSFSPDGETIASASEDGTVKLWNLQGQELQTLTGHDSTVIDVSFSPDDETIASADRNGTVKLWSLQSQKQQTLESHDSVFLRVSFSPDSETIASADRNGTVKLWNLQGQELQTLTGYDSTVIDVSFSPDGETIASASEDGTVKLWKLQGQKLQTLIASNNEIRSVDFSPDGETIASASENGTVKLWNLQGQELQTLTGHDNAVIDVSFSPDGETIASASEDGTVKLWNLQGQELQTFVGHNVAVMDVSFAPNGEIIASASLDGKIKLWNLQGQELQTLVGHGREILSVSFAPDGQTLASASRDRTVKLWTLQGEELQTLQGHSAEVLSVSFAPDGQTLASTSLDGTVKLWNFNLDDLLDKSCDSLRDYLQNPATLESERQALCPDMSVPVRQATSPWLSPLHSVFGSIQQWLQIET
ncbi:MAG: AAA family ATPase [Cyanobacteria bacterium P01_F01_bin.86]